MSSKAKPKRRALGKKARFEVFKRDSFTCQYCGAAAPEAVLNVDHIKPVANGGTNRITNLITSCFSCNSGKSDRELSDQTVVEKQRAQLNQLQERRNQLEMMMQWHEGVEEVSNDALDMVVDYVDKKLDGHGRSINDNGIKKLKPVVKKYPFQDVLKAVEIGFDQYIDRGGDFDENFSELLKKLPGICKHMHADEYDKKKFYCRRIVDMRHRPMHHTTASHFYELFAEAKSVKVPLDELVSIVKTASGIQPTIDAMEAAIASHKGADSL